MGNPPLSSKRGFPLLVSCKDHITQVLIMGWGCYSSTKLKCSQRIKLSYVNHHHLQVLVMIKLILTLHFLLFLHLNTFQPPSCYIILAWFTFCSAIKSVASLMRTRLWILIWLSNSCQSVWSVSFLHFPLCLFNRTRLCLMWITTTYRY